MDDTGIIDGVPVTDDDLSHLDFDVGGAGTTTTGPVTLSMQQIRSQINALNEQLSERTETGPELEALKRQAYAEFLAFVLENDAINFSKEDFAEALSISVGDADSQYYNFDFTDIEPLNLSYNSQVTGAVGDYVAPDNDYGSSVLGTDRSWTPQPITSADVEVPTAYDLVDAATLESYLPADLTRRVNNVTQDTPAYSAADILPATLFDAINFPAPTINRGVPVVTKGIDAQGNPTTGITMGNAAATPSGANIGQLDISTLLPSTGMGINADGSGTATVGTLDTTGNIVASSADTLNMLDTGLGNVSAVDPNVLSTAGGTTPVVTTTAVTTPATTKVCPIGTILAGQTIGINESCGVITDDPPATTKVCPIGTVLAGQTIGINEDCGVITDDPPPLTDAQVIQNLFNTSQTKDIAAQRIGDYAASVGGITAEDIAAAVTPILSGTIESPNRFGMGPVGAAQVMQAVNDFGYGQRTGGTDVASFITENPMIASTAQPVALSPAEQLAENNARLQYLNTQESAIGTGAYTEQEAAMRGLDFAKRQGMSLTEAGAGFGLDEAGVRAKADELGINLASLGFNQGGSVGSQDRSPVELRQDAVGSRLMRQTGLASLQGATMSPEMASTLDRIMARRK